jgi:hypothetical protein
MSEKQTGFVFVTTNTVTGPFYIGCHTDSVGMTRGPKAQKGAYIGYSTTLRAAFREYGPDAFEKKIVYEGPDFYDEKERLLAGAFEHAPELLYNKRVFNRRWTNEQRAKQREILSRPVEVKTTKTCDDVISRGKVLAQQYRARMAAKSLSKSTPVAKQNGYAFVTTNTITGMMYIGCHVDSPGMTIGAFENRESKGRYLGRNPHLQSDMKKYGRGAFEKVIVYEGPDYYDVKELLLADVFDQHPELLYNMTLRSRRWTEEKRERQRKILKGNKNLSDAILRSHKEKQWAESTIRTLQDKVDRIEKGQALLNRKRKPKPTSG